MIAKTPWNRRNKVNTELYEKIVSKSSSGDCSGRKLGQESNQLKKDLHTLFVRKEQDNSLADVQIIGLAASEAFNYYGVFYYSNHELCEFFVPVDGVCRSLSWPNKEMRCVNELEGNPVFFVNELQQRIVFLSRLLWCLLLVLLAIVFRTMIIGH